MRLLLGRPLNAGRHLRLYGGGNLVEGDPTIWASILGVPYFRKDPKIRVPIKTRGDPPEFKPKQGYISTLKK